MSKVPVTRFHLCFEPSTIENMCHRHLRHVSGTFKAQVETRLKYIICMYIVHVSTLACMVVHNTNLNMYSACNQEPMKTEGWSAQLPRK